MTIPIPEIRQYLTSAYSDDELGTLCADYFRDVYENFAAGMTKAQKIGLLLDYCQRREQLPNLRAALKRERPQQYPVHFAGDIVEVRPAAPQPQRDPRQVFISHAHGDAEFAHRLASDLQRNGWRVWIAPDSIRPGEKWAEAINRGLEESSVFVVALTPAAVASNWVKIETNLAIELAQGGEARFFPLLVSECRPPVLWTAFQRIIFSGRYPAGLADLLAALEQKGVKPQEIVATQPPVVTTPAPKPQPEPTVPGITAQSQREGSRRWLPWALAAVATLALALAVWQPWRGNGNPRPAPTLASDAAIGDNAGGGSVTPEVSTHRECRTLGTWNSTSALPIPNAHAPAVTYNDRIYVVGGGPTRGPHNTAYFALVQKDGSLEPWRQTTPLPGGATGYYASAVANGYLYVAGGSDGVGGSLGIVWYAPISSDGTLGSWVSPAALPEGLQGLRLVTYQGAIYLTGGSPSAQPRPQAIVYRANVQGDGSLDGWTPVSSLPIATSWHEAVVDKNYLYVVGGAIGSGRTRQVYFAAFGPNGELGAWRETTPLPLELANHTAVVIADVIYVAGGLPNADTSQSSVYSAAINSDGTLGAWQEVTALAQGLHDHSAAAVDRSMFIIGGFNTAKGKYSDAVYAASVQCE